MRLEKVVPPRPPTVCGGTWATRLNNHCGNLHFSIHYYKSQGWKKYIYIFDFFSMAMVNITCLPHSTVVWHCRAFRETPSKFLHSVKRHVMLHEDTVAWTLPYQLQLPAAVMETTPSFLARRSGYTNATSSNNMRLSNTYTFFQIEIPAAQTSKHRLGAQNVVC